MSTYVLYTVVAGEMTEVMRLHSIIKAETARQLENNFQRTYLASEEDYNKLKQYEIERKARA